VSRDGPFVVGLTGGIGSGKSAAGEHFAELGAGVVDTDAIAHALTGPSGAAMPAILKAFGSEIASADGALDRAAMRKRVFADPAERQRLEAILHPMIRAESDRRVAQLDATGVPYIILVVPLLVESMLGKGNSYRERVQRVAVVDCAPETQIRRVIERNGLPRSDVERILAVQATREQRLNVADDVIDNNGSFSELATQVDALDRDYRQFATIADHKKSV
jgi:dephospho-CoA kinase